MGKQIESDKKSKTIKNEIETLKKLKKDSQMDANSLSLHLPEQGLSERSKPPMSFNKKSQTTGKRTPKKENFMGLPKTSEKKRARTQMKSLEPKKFKVEDVSE